MNKKEYIIPTSFCINVQPSRLLSSSPSNKELRFDPNEGTDEALSNIWDDDWSETDTP